MGVDAQTLVLIDNSLSVSKVNRQITKATLKYFFENSQEGRAYCFAPFSHTLDYAESYTEDYIGLADMASRLEYENKEISLIDVLCATLNKWEESDFACRDILIFTDGKEEASINYEREELFYLLENMDYPVYIVCLDQEGNGSTVKNLSAMARVSGGKLFHSDFPGSDAEIERILTEQIQKSMDEYSANNWARYENENVDNSKSEGDEGVEDGAVDEEENESENSEITNVIKEENGLDTAFSLNGADSDVMYETRKNDDYIDPLTYAFVGGGLFLLVCIVFICWCLYLRHRKKLRQEEEEYRRRIRASVENSNMSGKLNEQSGYTENAAYYGNSARNADMGQTVSIFRRDISAGADDASTRLLYEGAGVCDVTFEDVNDPSKYYRCAIHGKITLGRSPDRCDLAFTYDDSVSSRHCEIYYRDDSYYVRDLESSNGTQVNGEKVYTESLLRDKDILKLGSLSMMVRFL